MTSPTKPEKPTVLTFWLAEHGTIEDCTLHAAHEKDYVREGAVLGLLRIGGEDAMRVLRTVAYDDRSTLVREAAQDALEHLEDTHGRE